MVEKFFEEWKKPKQSNKNTFLLLLITFMLGTFLTSIWNNFPDQQANAMVFMILAIVAGFIMLIEMFNPRIEYLRTLDIGEKPLIPILIGFGIGFFLNLGKFSIITPFSITITSGLILSFIFIVLAAVLIEEIFFRGVLQPILVGLFHDYLNLNIFLAGVFALILQAGMFAWFHWNVLGGNINLLGVTFIFAILVTIGNYYFKSIGFGIGAHGINNLIAWIIMVGLI